jgi:hypothetical protein
MKNHPADPRHVIIRNDADVTAFWAALMGSGGFAHRTLWLAMFRDDGRPIPVLMPMQGVPARPNRLFDNLASVIRSVAAQHDVHSLATLLARPGPTAITANDRRWAGILDEENTSLAKVWPAHLATCDRVVPLAPERDAAAS